MLEILQNLTTRTKELYARIHRPQLRKSFVRLMAYVQRPFYDLVIDLIKLSFAVSMAYLIVRVVFKIIINIWR